MLSLVCIIVAAVTSFQGTSVLSTEIDPHGYVVFCPCMGRFGNQLDYFLGSLAFAESLNRTLVLSPFIEYISYNPTSIQVPFDSYFRVDAVNEFHRAVTMETFISEIAPVVWPPDLRKSFCYQDRSHFIQHSAASDNAPGNTDACAAKFGNPSGPFWQHYNVDFVGSELHAPLLYDTVTVPSLAQDWRRRYPPTKWPVLAFAGAPASYPARRESAALRRFFVWSDGVVDRSRKLRQRLKPGAYVAAHLRIGSDWENACDHVESGGGVNMFSSVQCLGYRGQHGSLTSALCLPSPDDVARQLKQAARHVSASAVFIACDDISRLHKYTDLLRDSSFQVLTTADIADHSAGDPHAELALMARANLFVGNCVSSFTAVVSGERRHYGLPTWFWNFGDSAAAASDRSATAGRHNEL